MSGTAGSVRVLGVRHHSPACARLVARTIADFRPGAVLIEGPSDFNPRLGELALAHTLPLALYSFANEDGQPAQCWFPLLDYSPEWVALREGRAAGADVRFIDLPHWQYRVLPDTAREAGGTRPGRSRYGEVVAALCLRFGCDGDDALWDHLFESLPPDTDPAALPERLSLYFHELRGDDPGSEQDQARERRMAEWTAWAAARHERVLVVCGGWHQPVLERAWPALSGDTEPPVPEPADPLAAGCYLVPYAWRQVDALGGYAAGMPSPQFYQWVWEHGLAEAGRLAARHIVSRLRRREVPVSTADLVAFESASAGLAALRGHPAPLRVDLLDALQSSLVKEALDAPPPWSGATLLGTRHHPLLREALLALTGDGAGRLDGATPAPPLVADAMRRLAAADLSPTFDARTVVLDRRRPADAPRAQALWQLQVLGVGGVRLVETRAPRAAHGLQAALRFEEHWRLQLDDRWFPDLIAAAVHGATLEAAARQRLLYQVAQADGRAEVLAGALMQAVRAGLHGMGHELAARLREGLPRAHDHGAHAGAASTLAQVVEAGFWGEDPRALFEDTLVQLAGRLLWLLEGRDGAGSPASMSADVAAVSVFDHLLPLRLPGLDPGAVLDTLARLARSGSKPPALRGAALGVVCEHQPDEAIRFSPDDLLALVRATPPRDALGDFLFGLFSCARRLATRSDALVGAVHGALVSLGDEDFLVALPQLRGAFACFPPRERAVLAEHVARLMGLGAGEHRKLLVLRGGPEAWVDARRIEAQALAWATTFGVTR